MNTNMQVRARINVAKVSGMQAYSRYNKRAQNGPGIAVVEHRPGPDLSASLDNTEEH